MKRHPLLHLCLCFIALFTLNLDGCGCGNRALEEATDPDLTGIAINKSQTKSLGTINGRPVIEVEGKITKNQVGEDAEAFLLVIPKELSQEQVKSLVASFRKENPKEKKNATFEKKPGTSFPISTGRHKMLAYYLRDVGSKEEAAIKEKIALTDLEPGDYDLCLLLDYPHYGTAFSNIESLKELSIPAPGGTQPAIRLNKVATERKFITGYNCVRNIIDCNAAITNQPTSISYKGFLFIKKNQTPPITPQEILGTYIQEVKDLSRDDNFISIADNKAIIKKASKNFKINDGVYDQDDSNQPFERGTTYAVYGVMMYEEDSIKKYVVSEPRDMPTPSASVKLTMTEIEITSFRQCQSTPKLSAELEGVDVRYKANITKNEGTNKNAMGLIFSVDEIISSQQAQKVIVDLKKKIETEGYCKSGDSKQILYNIGDINNDTGDKENTVQTTHIPFDLTETRTYNVYCFVQDNAAAGGEVFLSSNSQTLTLHQIVLNQPEANLWISRKKGPYWKSGVEALKLPTYSNLLTNYLFGVKHILGNNVDNTFATLNIVDEINQALVRHANETLEPVARNLPFFKKAEGSEKYYLERYKYCYQDDGFMGNTDIEFNNQQFFASRPYVIWGSIDREPLKYYSKDCSISNSNLAKNKFFYVKRLGDGEKYCYNFEDKAIFESGIEDGESVYHFLRKNELLNHTELDGILDAIFIGPPGDEQVEEWKKSFKDHYAEIDPRIKKC